MGENFDIDLKEWDRLLLTPPTNFFTEVYKNMLAWEEEMVRRMLGRWVSGLTPAVVHLQRDVCEEILRPGKDFTYCIKSTLLGLTAEEYPVGIVCPILVRVEDVLSDFT